MSDPIRLWFWIITDELTGKRRKSTWRMTEQDACAYPGAVKVEGSLKERTSLGNTSALTHGLRLHEQN